MTDKQSKDLKEAAIDLARKIDYQTGKLVTARLNQDADESRKAELRLLALTNASEQFLTYLIDIL